MTPKRISGLLLGIASHSKEALWATPIHCDDGSVETKVLEIAGKDQITTAIAFYGTPKIPGRTSRCRAFGRSAIVVNVIEPHPVKEQHARRSHGRRAHSSKKLGWASSGLDCSMQHVEPASKIYLASCIYPPHRDRNNLVPGYPYRLQRYQSSVAEREWLSP